MFGTCIPRTTVGSARLRPLKVRTSVSSHRLSTYARVNEYGFIETPYRIVVGRVVTEEIKFFTALEEENQVIAQAKCPLDDKGNITQDVLIARAR